MNIGGNVYATLQTKSTTVNTIGERIPEWEDYGTILGWLDLSSGDSKHTDFNAKLQESTHMFLCDYTSLAGVTIENARLLINGLVYEILLIDNPMGMNEHLEIYLRYVGGEQSVG